MPSSLHNDLQKFLLKKLSFYSPKREVRFGAINRTADILIESKKLIFEIQCSSISKKEVIQRNADYQQRGYRTIWILHAKQFGKKIPTQVERYLQQREYYYTNYAQGGGEIYDKVFFPKKTGFQYIHPVDIQTICPFLHTRATTALKQHAQYYCKGDIIDLLLHSSETADALMEVLFPKKIPIKTRFWNYFKLLFEGELVKHCDY